MLIRHKNKSRKKDEMERNAGCQFIILLSLPFRSSACHLSTAEKFCNKADMSWDAGLRDTGLSVGWGQPNLSLSNIQFATFQSFGSLSFCMQSLNIIGFSLSCY